MTRNAERCVFANPADVRDDPQRALTAALADLPEGMILVYDYAPIRNMLKKCPIRMAAATVAYRSRCALVQWPDGPASLDSRKWCYGIQKPKRDLTRKGRRHARA